MRRCFVKLGSARKRLNNLKLDRPSNYTKRRQRLRICLALLASILFMTASFSPFNLNLFRVRFVADKPTQVAGNPGWFFTFVPCGGLSNNRISILGAAAVAKATNSGIILPPVPIRTQMCVSDVPCPSYKNSTEWWKNVVEFDYLFDVNFFVEELRKHSVPVLRQEPPCVRRHSARNRAKMSISWEMKNFSYYRSHPQLNAPLKLAPETSPNNLFGWLPECNLGVIDLGCTLFNFKPTPDDFVFWDSFLSAQKFSRAVLEIASEITALLGDEFVSIHLRIESDMPRGMRPDDDTDPVASVVRALDNEEIEQNASVFVSSGASWDSRAMQQFIGAEGIQKYGFNFVTVDSLRHQLPDLEFAAAVSYVVCMRSYVHVGPMSSSFDVLLDIERRRIRTGNTKFRPYVVALNNPLGIFTEAFPKDFLQHVGQHVGH